MVPGFPTGWNAIASSGWPGGTVSAIGPSAGCDGSPDMSRAQPANVDPAPDESNGRATRATVTSGIPSYLLGSSTTLPDMRCPGRICAGRIKPTSLTLVVADDVAEPRPVLAVVGGSLAACLACCSCCITSSWVNFF